MSTLIPNTFQCFNLYVDRAMEHLTDSEVRVLWFATRHILGWQDKIKKQHGHISISMFENGYTTASGKRYAGCGIGRAAIITACAKLVEYKFLSRIGEANEDGQEWELTTDDIQWSALETRTFEKQSKRKDQTKVASIALKAKLAGSSDDTSVGGSFNDTMQGSFNDTTPISLNDTESKPSSKPSSKPRAKAQPPTSTETKLPKRTAKFTRAYILAYNKLMGTNSNLLVSAWHEGMHTNMNTLPLFEAQIFIETNEELERLNVGTDKYSDFVKHVKKVQSWKGRDNPVQPSEMVKCITSFKESLKKVSAAVPTKPMTEAEYDLLLIKEKQEKEAALYGWS